MRFISTRGGEITNSSAKAIINGLCLDGGLYVPENIPVIYNNLKEKMNLKYEELAFEIIKEIFDDMPSEDLRDSINDSYKERFDVNEENGFLELYHGPTSAFKDAALLFLPQVMKRAKKLCDVEEDIVILTATSGDTGKAALEGFSNVEGFKVVVYYPKNGVSAIQERQMSTQRGNNVKVIGIEGDFDNAQTGVKNIFADNKFRKELTEKGYILSSANSINIGRLVPQIVYYFYGYFKLVNSGKVNEGDKINVVVPTGNFGNILAAYYAKKMGLPVDKFICASNDNKVLTDFFKTGVYDKRRELVLTESPSMDILVSSNLERLLFEVSNRSSEEVKALMEALNKNGVYAISDTTRDGLKEFYGEYANSEEVYAAIKEVFENDGYLMDTHTAVAYVVLQKYIKETGDDKPYLLASTASPYKFPRSICNALSLDVENINDFDVLKALNEYTKVDIPKNLRDLDKEEILHDEVWDKAKMDKALYSYLVK